MRVFVPALVMILALAAVGVTLAQEPSPTPTPVTTPQPGTPPTPVASCPPQISFEGPATRTINQAQIQVPAGSYSLGITPPGLPDGAFSLCHLETGAIITMSGKTCAELGRSASSAEGTAVLNQIISSCKVVPLPTPQVPPFSCPGRGDENEIVVDAPGGRPLLIADAIQVTLPAGRFVVRVLGSSAAICASNYSLVLSMADCRRVDIRPPDGANVPGLALADAIVASCVVINPVEELPVPPPVQTGGNIRPPSTGDGGLQ